MAIPDSPTTGVTPVTERERGTLYPGTVIKATDIGAGGARSETQSTLEQPLAHLVACHRRIEERMDTLERVIPHWQDRAAEALEAVQSTFRFLEANGVWHTEDEEQSLFPRLRPKLTSDECAYVEELERQHDVAEAAYAGLKDLVSGLDAASVSPEWIASYEASARRLARLYREHIASEDSRLMEIGARLLVEDELRTIAGEMKARRGLPQ